MADALISVVLQQLATIFDRELQQEVKLVVGVEKEVQKLTSNLRAIQSVLEDAERRQLKEAAVKDWLNKLKDVFYGMDDLLDEWSSSILKLQIAGGDNGLASKWMVCSFLSSPCFSFKQVFHRHDMALKVKELAERLEVIAEEKNKFGFNLYRATKEPERPRSTSFGDLSGVCGRDNDKKNVVRMLCESNQVGEIHVISIVGMGGIGKTTLAQLVYNDDEVKSHFEKRIWVCVSDPFDETKIAKAIIEALKGASPNLVELQSLLQVVSESIEGKKFLLVLDDVWTEDYGKWEPLKQSLNSGAPGSRILVTTRKNIAAKVMKTTHLFNLEELSREDCWSLFSQVAFYGRSRVECEKLIEFSWRIADKSKGLPLAAKTLGGLMQFKKTEEEWQNVLSSELWELDEIERGLFPPLLLSYYDFLLQLDNVSPFVPHFQKAM